MPPLVAKAIWVLGVVGWFVIRYPHDRRARRTPKLRRANGRREIMLMTISAAGLGIIPFLYVISDGPRFANYTFHPWQAWLGAAGFGAAPLRVFPTPQDPPRALAVTPDR